MKSSSTKVRHFAHGSCIFNVLDFYVSYENVMAKFRREPWSLQSVTYCDMFLCKNRFAWKTKFCIGELGGNCVFFLQRHSVIVQSGESGQQNSPSKGETSSDEASTASGESSKLSTINIVHYNPSTSERLLHEVSLNR